MCTINATNMHSLYIRNIAQTVGGRELKGTVISQSSWIKNAGFEKAGTRFGILFVCSGSKAATGHAHADSGYGAFYCFISCCSVSCRRLRRISASTRRSSSAPPAAPTTDFQWPDLAYTIYHKNLGRIWVTIRDFLEKAIFISKREEFRMSNKCTKNS